MTEAFLNPLARNGPSVINSARAIKSWARLLLALQDEAVISVSELVCHVPGCPPKETVILVMQGTETVQASVHKPMKEVTEEDVAHAFSAAPNLPVWVSCRRRLFSAIAIEGKDIQVRLSKPFMDKPLEVIRGAFRWGLDRLPASPLTGRDGSPTHDVEGNNREHGAGDPHGTKTVAAPATVSGLPSILVALGAMPLCNRHGKADGRQISVSQETCRHLSIHRHGRGSPE